MSIQVTGVRETLRAFRRLNALEQKARFAALSKVAREIRGKIRREIVAKEDVKLNTTRKRVQWFWRGTRNSKRRNIKVWVGTKYPQFPSKGDKEKPRSLRPRKVDIADTAQTAVPKISQRLMKRRYPILFKAQLTRKLASFRG